MQAGGAARDEGDLLGLGLGAHPVDGLGDDGVQVDVVGLDQRVPLLEAGELHDLLDEHAQARGLPAYAADVVAHDIGVVDGALDGLGQQGDSADWGLELVGDIGHEVAAHVLQPLGGGAVLDEDEDAAAPNSGHAHVQVELAGPGDASAGDGQLGLLGRPPGSHPGDHLGHLRLADLVVAHDVVGVGGGGGAQHLVVVVEHDDGRAQRRQDGHDAVVLKGGARGDAVRAGAVQRRSEGEGGSGAYPDTHYGDADQQHEASHTPRVEAGRCRSRALPGEPPRPPRSAATMVVGRRPTPGGRPPRPGP